MSAVLLPIALYRFTDNMLVPLDSPDRHSYGRAAFRGCPTTTERNP